MKGLLKRCLLFFWDKLFTWQTSIHKWAGSEKPNPHSSSDKNQLGRASNTQQTAKVAEQRTIRELKRATHAAAAAQLQGWAMKSNWKRRSHNCAQLAARPIIAAYIIRRNKRNRAVGADASPNLMQQKAREPTYNSLRQIRRHTGLSRARHTDGGGHAGAARAHAARHSATPSVANLQLSPPVGWLGRRSRFRRRRCFASASRRDARPLGPLSLPRVSGHGRLPHSRRAEGPHCWKTR